MNLVINMLMKTFKTTITLLFILFCGPVHSSFEELERLATVMSEAQVLIESRIFLKGLNEQLKNGEKIDKNLAFEISAKAERIAINGCDCEEEELDNVLRSQAYVLVAGINGILSKESKSIKLGRKSYHSLAKARELDPGNTDAIKGQAIALNAILSKGWFVRNAAAMALKIDLEDAQKELIDDLRRFPDRSDLERLANQLEDKL